MLSQNVSLALLAEQLSLQAGARGLLVAGFPRDLQQLRAFESKVNSSSKNKNA
jgi:adenylate kinase family enzyme